MAYIVALDHIQIAAPKGSETLIRSFYAGLLGIKEIPKPDALSSRGGVWFDLGNMQMHVGMDDDPANSQSRRHVAFQVTSLDDIREMLLQASIEIEKDQAPLPGIQRFYCRDYVGNRVEFLVIHEASNTPIPD